MTALGPARTIPDHRAKARASRPGILLDRDGTLIVDHGYVGSIDRVDFIDGAAEAIAVFNRAAFPVVVVTNQSGVARGLYGLDEVEAVHAHIAGHLAATEPTSTCSCTARTTPSGVVEAFARTSDDRKPRPGMAKAAATALNLDLTASWVIGDRPEDIGLAKEIGASRDLSRAGTLRQTAGVELRQPGRGSAVHPGADPDMTSVHDPEVVARSRRGATAPSSRPRPYPDASSYFDDYHDDPRPGCVDDRPRCSRTRRAPDPRRLHARGSCIFACGNGGSAAIANHLQCDHVKGVRADTDLSPRVVSLSQQRRAHHGDRQRHRLRRRLRVPAPHPGEARRRAARDLVLRPLAEHRPRADVAARDHGVSHHRAHRLRRRRRAGGSPTSPSMSTHELRHRRRPPSGDHARPGPVHPPVANDRRGDLFEGVLNHGHRASSALSTTSTPSNAHDECGSPSTS